MCRPCPWHGVWWILLFLYTPVLHTSMSILRCPSIQAPDGSTVPRWYINGNISCFSGAHIPLAILAIIVLGLCVALVPLSLLISLDKLTRPRWLHYLSMALTDAYKPKVKWWSGVELAKRLVLVLFSVAFKNNEYPIIFILMVLLGVLGFLKPYKSRAVNVLDTILASDIVILLLLRNTEYIKDILQYIPEQPDSNLSPPPPSPERNSTDRECLEIVGMSPFAILLTPFYYLPLLIAITTCIIWVTYYAYVWSKDCYSVYNSKPSVDIDVESTVGSPFDVSRMRTRTQTVVDIRQYDPDQESPIELSLPAVLEHRHPDEGKASEDSFTPLASLYLKAKRASSKRKASHRLKRKESIELQRVPESRSVGPDQGREKEAEEKEEEKDKQKLENSDSYTLI